MHAQVLNIDAENQRLSLGLKQLQTDVWDEFFSQHNVGDTVEGKVVRLTNFGAFVELAEGIEGLIHVSEIAVTPQARLHEVRRVGKTGTSFRRRKRTRVELRLLMSPPLRCRRRLRGGLGAHHAGKTGR